MSDVQNLGGFVLAGWLLNLVPGPDVLCVVSSALRSGARAGIAAALGISAGCLVHVCAAAMGLGALMAASSHAFEVLKWLGAAYLFGVGLRLVFARGGSAGGLAPSEPVPAHADTFKGLFLKGFLTNALNPKVVLFFLAFVPQFIDPQASHPVWAFVGLGALFSVNALPVNMGYALLAAWATRRLPSVQTALQGLNRVAGVMFVGFGIQLALSKAPQP